MVVQTTKYEVTFDGVQFHDYAMNLETLTGRRGAPAQRISTTVVPGRDGVIVDFDDSFEPGQFIVKGWVRGCDERGVVPSLSSARREFDQNVDTLFGLLGSARGRAITLTQRMGDQSVRTAKGIVTDIVTPDMFAPNAAKFAVSFMLPESFWEEDAIDWLVADATSRSSWGVNTLEGSTAPIDDLRIAVAGPIGGPRLTDIVTGQWVQLNRTLGVGEVWLMDAGLRITRYGTALSVESANTAGSDGFADTVFSGRFKMFSMRSGIVGESRMPIIGLTGSGATTATSLTIRGSKKFL